MKKIFLTCAVAALTFLASEAQTKKSTGKKKAKTTVSSEAKLNADIAKIKQEKKEAMELQRLERLTIDSARRADEMLAEQTKDMERIAWKEQKLKEVDSTNQANWKKQAEEKDQWYATERSQLEINKAAKLSDNQGRQVKAINISYNAKAKAIIENVEFSEAQRKEQLTALNLERRTKIKAIIGNNKEKNLEKERSKYAVKHTDDKESAWLNEVAITKNK